MTATLIREASNCRIVSDEIGASSLNDSMFRAPSTAPSPAAIICPIREEALTLKLTEMKS